MNFLTPKVLLRLEGATVLALGVTAYAWSNAGWAWFALLFLAPDLAMLGYVFGLKTGAASYNAAHNYALPAGVGLVCFFVGRTEAIPWLMIWMAHIGFDRMLNYGLKYPTAFKDTHLGRT
jgi:Domain of unknown function (DUF4260)